MSPVRLSLIISWDVRLGSPPEVYEEPVVTYEIPGCSGGLLRLQTTLSL